MSEFKSYTIIVDDVEYELEVIGDEVVVSNFSKAWGTLVAVLQKPSAETFSAFLAPKKPLFSFPATPELKALIIEANEYFDRHDEALEGVEPRLIQIATPFIREHLTKQKL